LTNTYVIAQHFYGRPEGATYIRQGGHHNCALAHISSLWSPYVIGQTIYIFILFLSSFFFFFYFLA